MIIPNKYKKERDFQKMYYISQESSENEQVKTDYWQSEKIFQNDWHVKISELTEYFEKEHFKKFTEENKDKITLEINNKIKLPNELTEKIDLSWGDELYAEIFDDELKQIVIGKKLHGKEAIKGLDKISEILKEDQ